jgi:uncharacterized membrane protein
MLHFYSILACFLLLELFYILANLRRQVILRICGICSMLKKLSTPRIDGLIQKLIFKLSNPSHLETDVRHFSMAEDDESKSRIEYRLDRTLAISDGVFAFAITLLVLDLMVPSLSPGASSIGLWQALSKEYTSFFSYILSFLIAGVWWNAHHRNFEHIRNSDSTIRWLNLLFLLWIALLPFFTKILDQYINLQLGVVLYAIDQTAAGIFLTLTWVYASRNHRLIGKEMKESAIRFATLRNVIAPIFFIASIGISFVSPGVALLSWFGMFPVLAIAYLLERKKWKEMASKN